jgi:SAM-dependent methyltransferase
MSQWLDFWNTSSDYQQEKTNSFNIVNHYLKTPPATILDIGCGLAFESRMFNKRYGSELWLLDGDVNDNPKTSRDIRFGAVETMAFYNKLEDIEQALKHDNIDNYTLLNAKNFKIPKEQKFDIICSWFSCGFHYPLDAYKELILAHSHHETKLIFDLRTKTADKLGVEILQILEQGEKHIKAVIKF